ncbi:hypothetical protein Tco_0210964 [Tanacetum coccineum]
MQGGRLWRCLCVAAEMKPQSGDVANLATKKWIQGACKLLRNEGGASLRCLYCMSTLPIKGMRSIIYTVSISLEGFLPSILLLVVTVVIVAVILVVVVVAIVGVVVVVGVSAIIKLSFVIIGFLRRIMFYYLLHQPLGYGNGFTDSPHFTHTRIKSVQRCDAVLHYCSNLAHVSHDKRFEVMCDAHEYTFIQRVRSIISTVSIILEGFLPSILLLVVIIVTVVIVAVILVVFVVAIVGVFIVVMIIGLVVVVGVSAIIKLLFDITEFFLEFKTSRDRYRDNRMSDPIGGLEFLGSSGTGSLPSGCVDLTGDGNPTDEDGDIEIGKVVASLLFRKCSGTEDIDGKRKVVIVKNNNSGASRLGFFTCFLLLGLLRTSLDVLDQTLDSIDGDDVERLWNELAKLETIMEVLELIIEYLVKDRKRRTFWSLNEDILKITILKTNTSYPSRKIQHIHAFTHQRPQRNKAQYAVSRRSQYAILKILYVNILEDIKRGPYSKKSQYAVSNPWIRRIEPTSRPYK